MEVVRSCGHKQDINAVIVKQHGGLNTISSTPCKNCCGEGNPLILTKEKIMGSIRIHFIDEIGRGQDDEKYEPITDQATNTLNEICGLDSEVDWRDWNEVEIHNVKDVETSIKTIHDTFGNRVGSVEDISDIR